MTMPHAVDEATALHRHYWGPRHTSRVAEQLIEEMAELTVELSHFLRGRNDVNIIEEMADVEICLTVLKDALGIRRYPTTTGEFAAEADYQSTMTKKALRLIGGLEAMRKKERPSPERASS